VGNQVSTKDISQKDYAQSIEACKNSEGVFKVNRGNLTMTAFCKNNDTFELKAEK